MKKIKGIRKVVKLLRFRWIRGLFLLGGAGAAGFFARELIEENKILEEADRDCVGSVRWENEQKRQEKRREKEEAKIEKERAKKYERL